MASHCQPPELAASLDDRNGGAYPWLLLSKGCALQTERPAGRLCATSPPPSSHRIKAPMPMKRPNDAPDWIAVFPTVRKKPFPPWPYLEGRDC